MAQMKDLMCVSWTTHRMTKFSENIYINVSQPELFAVGFQCFLSSAGCCGWMGTRKSSWWPIFFSSETGLYLCLYKHFVPIVSLFTSKSFCPCVCASRYPKDPNVPQSHLVPSSPVRVELCPVSLMDCPPVDRQFHSKSNGNRMVSFSLSYIHTQRSPSSQTTSSPIPLKFLGSLPSL